MVDSLKYFHMRTEHLFTTIAEAIKKSQTDSPNASIHIFRLAAKFALDLLNTDLLKTHSNPIMLLATGATSALAGIVVGQQFGRKASDIAYDVQHDTSESFDLLKEYNPSTQCSEMYAVSNRVLSVYFALNRVGRHDFLTDIQKDLALPVAGVIGTTVPTSFWTDINSHRRAVFFGCLEVLFNGLDNNEVTYEKAREMLDRLTKYGSCIKKYAERA
jgi:hypothetical protein